MVTTLAEMDGKPGLDRSMWDPGEGGFDCEDPVDGSSSQMPRLLWVESAAGAPALSPQRVLLREHSEPRVGARGLRVLEMSSTLSQ